MVTVSFDPTLIPQPAPAEEPKGPLTLPEDPFQKAPDDPKRIAEEKEAKDKADRAKADRDRKIADGQKRVNELSERFAGWYYVTPGDSFKAISLDRGNLIQDPKPKAAAPGGMPPGMGASPTKGFPVSPVSNPALNSVFRLPLAVQHGERGASAPFNFGTGPGR